MANARSRNSLAWRGLQATLFAAREVALTLLQVALFLAIFLFIVQTSLPQGTGLQAVYGEILSRKDRAVTTLTDRTPYDLGPVATLTAVTRRVKDRPADFIAWKDSTRGMELQDHHAIQTLARSEATITLQDDNELWLDENSLVVIKRPATGPARSRRATLLILGGKVRGSVAPKIGKGPGQALNVELAGGSATIRSSSPEQTEFSVQVNADQSSTLSVTSGLAEIEKAGRTVRLGTQEALRIEADGAVGRPTAIPVSPRQQFPAEGFVHTMGPSTPPLEFRWAEAPRADAYRVEIARDPGFGDSVFDSRFRTTSTRPAGLAPGRYHWRVSALAGEVESEPGDSRSFEVVADSAPPALKIVLPPGPVASERLIVRGTAEPGSRVLVGNSQVELAADGSFEHEVDLVPGPNLIVVEAVDAAGNVTYQSQYVYAK